MVVEMVVEVVKIYMAGIPTGHHVGYTITSQEYLLGWGVGRGGGRKDR